MAQVQVTQVVHTNNTDDLYVTGTVNGTQFTAHGWVSATTGMTGPQKLAYVAGLLRDAWRAAQPPPTTDLGVNGSLTLPD